MPLVALPRLLVLSINTTDSVGNVTAAAKAMQQRLLDGGISKDDM
jgi:hypothetical protein